MGPWTQHLLQSVNIYLGPRTEDLLQSVNIYLQRQSVCPSVCVFVSPCHNIDTGVGRRRFAARGTDLVACTDPFILCIIQSTNTSVCTWGWERSGGAGILTLRFDLTSKSEVGIQLKKLRIVRHYWGIQVKELAAEIHSDKGTSQATQEYWMLLQTARYFTVNLS